MGRQIRCHINYFNESIYKDRLLSIIYADVFEDCHVMVYNQYNIEHWHTVHCLEKIRNIEIVEVILNIIVS